MMIVARALTSGLTPRRTLENGETISSLHSQTVHLSRLVDDLRLLSVASVALSGQPVFAVLEAEIERFLEARR